jgi:methyl-accepting chemotaxis protein
MHENTEAFVADLDEARGEVKAAREEAEQLADDLQRQAGEAAEVLERAADGDLTARMDADRDSEAMRTIATEFNAMLADLEGTVVEIERFSDEVAGASERVSRGSSEVASAAEQGTTTASQMAGSADELDDLAEELRERLDEFTVDDGTVDTAGSADTSPPPATTGRRPTVGKSDPGRSRLRLRNSHGRTLKALGTVGAIDV